MISIDPSESDMAWRCHQNCIENSRDMARVSRSNGAVVERDGVLLFATGSDFPVLVNGAFRIDPAVGADAVIDLADAWFAERGRGWSLGTSSWLGADQDLVDAALRRNMVATVNTPGMICDVRVAESPIPDGVTVKILSTDDEESAFTTMLDSAYTSLGMPGGVFSMARPRPMRTPLPHVVTVGAFDDGVLVSGAFVTFSHGIAGVYAVGTAEGHRGRGLARLVTQVVTNIGFDGGAPYVTLQATSMGEPIYRRMGYRELYRFVNYTRFV